MTREHGLSFKRFEPKFVKFTHSGVDIEKGKKEYKEVFDHVW